MLPLREPSIFVTYGEALELGESLKFTNFRIPGEESAPTFGILLQNLRKSISVHVLLFVCFKLDSDLSVVNLLFLSKHGSVGKKHFSWSWEDFFNGL